MANEPLTKQVLINALSPLTNYPSIEEAIDELKKPDIILPPTDYHNVAQFISNTLDYVSPQDPNLDALQALLERCLRKTNKSTLEKK